MKANVFGEILEWSLQRPAWQRDALRRLFTSGDLASGDFDQLTELCKAGHGLAPTQKSAPLQEEHLPISAASSIKAVSLVTLTHHHGVNALAAEKTLSFGPNLTIVYGENAAGKSGYTRILKRACRSRFVEDVLGDVLSTAAPLKANATIVVRRESVQTTVPWTPDGTPSPMLAEISVFDGHCVPIYLRDKTDVAFRPFGLDVFDKLASACIEIKKRLDSEIQRLSMGGFVVPAGLISSTAARRIVDGLSSLTKEKDIQVLATLTEADERRLKELISIERELKASDPKTRANELISQARRIDALATHVTLLADTFGLAAMRDFGVARDKLRTARKALDVIRTAALTAGLLPSTGGPEWRAMWDAAEQFGEVALSGKAFPPSGTNSKCPFCQQDIDSGTDHRLKHFATFVRSTAQQDVRQAESVYFGLRNALLDTKIDLPAMEGTLVELAADHGATADRIKQSLTTARELRDAIQALTEAGVEPIIAKTFEPKIGAMVTAIADALRARAKQLQASQSSLSSAQQTELNELSAREALRTHLDSVLNEIDRKRRIAAYIQCLDDTSTSAITKKSTELTKQLITDQLRQTFQDELKRLQFSHLAVEIQSAGGSRGALFHKLAFSNAPSVKMTDVLSEGESRALSLAAFMTELSTATTQSGIIFDDPVSSLDHKWREKIGRRLVTEATTRQVVVFTHDLLFLRLLIDEAERNGVPFQHQYIRRERHQAGLTSSDLPFVAMSVKERLGVLRNRLQTVTTIHSGGSLIDYESQGRELFRLLRETWERGISEVLLNDVVDRYRPSIQTQRVAWLDDITAADCKTVDDEMTECSRWVHDEALAAGLSFPEPTDITIRINTLETWAKVIRARRK